MSKIDKLTKQVQEHLDPNENVVASVLGAYEVERLGKSSVRRGAFLATDKRLVFFVKKLIGYDMEVFPYSNISSIEISKGIMGHTISFFASGNEGKMKWIKGQDESVRELVGYVRDHIGK